MPVQDYHYRLSVLLVTYNHEKHNQQALRSLFKQMIADDGSTVDTLVIIRKLEGTYSRFQFKYLKKTQTCALPEITNGGLQRALGNMSQFSKETTIGLIP